MSKKETKKPEDEAAAGSSWTEQDWPPFKAEEGESGVKDADYYREHPDEIDDFATKLIDLRGGKDKLDEGSKWDPEKRAHIDAHGAPREWGHLTKYLRDNPDELDRFVEEYRNLEYFKKHPEDLSKFVRELVRLRGGEDGIKEGEWDTESVTHVDEGTDVPRDWAHLTGYLKKNPGELARFVSEYMTLKDEAEDGGEELPDEAAAEGSPTEDEPSEDKDEYPGESERAKGYDEKDYHPRFEGETDEMYKKRLEWEQMVREKSERYPRFYPPEKTEGEYPRIVSHDDYKEYDKYRKKHPDGEPESDAEWLERVGIPSLEEYLLKGSDKETSAAEGGGRTRWSMMTKEEKLNLIRENKRDPGEKTVDWAKRLGIKEIVPDTKAKPGSKPESAAEGAEKEISREEMLAVIKTGAAQRWIFENRKGNLNAIEAMSDEELRKLYDEYMRDRSMAEGGKEDEKSREELIGALKGEKAQKWLKERGLNLNALEAMSDDDLRKLYEDYLNDNKEEAESDEDKERERLLKLMAAGDFQKWLFKNHHKNLNWLEGLSAKEMQDLYDQYLNREGEEVDNPLVMARIDREKDARAAAHDFAERTLSEKLQSKKGLIGAAQRAIFGNFLREGMIKRYEHRAYEMIRAKQRGENVEGLTEDDWATKSGLERFVTAYVEGYEDEMIHGKAGESMDSYRVEKDEDGNEVVAHYYMKDGERQSEILEGGPMYEATIKMRDAVRAYAQGGSREEFEQTMGDIQQELRGNGGNSDKLMADNYIAVAEAARARYEHGKGIDDVMAGFAFVNGEARSNVRTEAHRDALDKITNRISNSVIGRLLPPEVVGTAASLAVRFGKSNVRRALIIGGSAVLGATVAPVVMPLVVGAATGGIFAGLKERNRVTGDRATQARRLAQGETIGSREYDKRMRDTQYEQYEAEKITSKINEALESGDAGKIRDALAIADVAVDMSDRESIDLITYKSGDTDVIEQQRMEMDIARAKARAELKRLGVPEAELKDAVRETTEIFEQDISEKDKAFRQLRRRRVAAMAAKTMVTTGLTSMAAQEVVSLFRPDQVGVLENMGAKIIENKAGATNTFLAGAMGMKGVEHLRGQLTQTGVVLSDDKINELRSKGYTVTEGRPIVHESTSEVSAHEWAEANENGRCVGYFNNGTSGSDGNELHGYYRSSGENRGPWTRITDRAWGSGRSISAKDVTAENSAFFATIEGKKIMIPAVAGEKSGVFYPDYDQIDPRLADIVRDGQFSRIQFGYLTGEVADGKADYISFWSYSGSGKVPETFTSTVREVTKTWDVTGPDVTSVVERDVSGFPTFGIVGRQNLTLGKRAHAEKPKNIGGAPRTHIERRAETAPERPSVATVHDSPETSVETPPAEHDSGGEAPVETPVEGETSVAEGAPAETTTVPETPPVTAETTAAEDGSEASAETAPTPETPEVSFDGPVSLASESYDIIVDQSPENIRALVKKSCGEDDLSDMEVMKVRYAINRWNSLGYEWRESLLKGEVDPLIAGFIPTVDMVRKMYDDVQTMITLYDYGLVMSEHVPRARLEKRYWKAAIESKLHPTKEIKSPVRHDSESLDFPNMPTIAELLELGKSKGITAISQDDWHKIQSAITRWNSIEEKFRRNMLDGRDLVEGRGYFAHGDSRNDIGRNEEARDILVKFGLIEVVPLIPKAASAEAKAAAGEAGRNAEEDDDWAA